jgi:hypothetical protein
MGNRTTDGESERSTHKIKQNLNKTLFKQQYLDHLPLYGPIFIYLLLYLLTVCCQESSSKTVNNIVRYRIQSWANSIDSQPQNIFPP